MNQEEQAQRQFETAKRLAESADFEVALLHYDRSVELRPDDPLVLHKRGVALYRLGRYEDALQDYNRSLELRPNQAETLNNRGVVFDDLGRYEEALRDYNRSLDLCPDDPGTLNNRAGALLHLRRHEEALRDCNHSLELRPDDPGTLFNRGILLDDLGHYEEALRDYNRSLELRPDDPGTITYLGNTLFHLGRYDEALQSYDRAIELDPRHALSLLLRGQLLATQGKLRDALRDLQQAISCFRADANATGERITRYWMLDLRRRIREEASKREPPVEVRILRSVREKLQGNPQGDPYSLIKEREEDFERYFSRPRTISPADSFFTVLRRWNSFTPKLPNRETVKRGGGYFLVWKGKGIVIDPGFDFLDNFDDAGYSIQDVDAIVITHAHTDHTADLEPLLCLKHEEEERLGHDSKVDLFMNLGTMHKFIGWISRIKGVGKVVTLNAGDSVEPEGYHLLLKATDAKHSDVIGTKCLGLLFDLREGSSSALRLGITGDTGWSSKIQGQYRGCQLLCVHLGSIGDNEFDETLPLRGKRRLYPEHLGLIGTISMVKAIRSHLSIVSEFGEELGSQRCHIAQALDRAFDADRRCFTGDIGLKVRLPDLCVYCEICGDYRECSSILETPFKAKEKVVYCCSSHTREELLDRLVV